MSSQCAQFHCPYFGSSVHLAYQCYSSCAHLYEVLLYITYTYIITYIIHIPSIEVFGERFNDHRGSLPDDDHDEDTLVSLKVCCVDELLANVCLRISC